MNNNNYTTNNRKGKSNENNHHYSSNNNTNYRNNHNNVKLFVLYLQTWCRYRFYNDPDHTVTETGQGKNPRYDHSNLVRLSKSEVDHKVSEHLIIHGTTF